MTIVCSKGNRTKQSSILPLMVNSYDTTSHRRIKKIKNNAPAPQVEMGRPTQRKGGKKKGNKTIKRKNCDERPILRFSFGDRVECITERGWETGTSEFQLYVIRHAYPS